MKKFEYLTLLMPSNRTDTEEYLNHYGKFGWELVQIWETVLFLKREITDE